MNQKNQVNVAIFGHGFLGKWHTQKAKVLESSQLKLIVEPNEKMHQEISETYPDVKVVTDFRGHEDLFEAAIVATPTSIHFDLCLDLLKSEKHVFCEKPVTSTYKQSLELQKILPSYLVFQVGHSERCHEVWEKDQSWRPYLEGKASLEFTRVAPFKGRATDVDVVQDLMIHDLDLLVWLTGEKPVSVEAKGYKIRTDKWDHAEALYTFASGKKARIIVGRNDVADTRKARFVNDQGVVEIDLAQEKIRISSKSSAPGDDGVELVECQKRDHLLIEQEHFYNSILEHSPAFVGLNEGIQAVYLVEQTLKSMETEQKVEL